MDSVKTSWSKGLLEQERPALINLVYVPYIYIYIYIYTHTYIYTNINSRPEEELKNLKHCPFAQIWGREPIQILAELTQDMQQVTMATENDLIKC